MGSDTVLQAYLASLPVPVFDPPAFTVPEPLSEATVAVVTTAAFHHADQPGFAFGDQSYRVLDATRDDLVLGHVSPNFDRTGMLADRNVVLPTDRLRELADDGTIGAVSPVHLAFLGAQDETMSTIRHESGPAAAATLREHGVDVVVLTPV